MTKYKNGVTLCSIRYKNEWFLKGEQKNKYAYINIKTHIYNYITIVQYVNTRILTGKQLKQFSGTPNEYQVIFFLGSQT